MSLLVVGALHLDVVLRAPHVPALDETVAGSAVDYVFGGKAGNQAVAAARLGAEVAFAGRVGADAFGHKLRHTLAHAGVDITQLQDDPGPSGMSAAIVDAQGDYAAVIVSAANLNIDAGAIRIPDGTELVLLQNEIPEAVNLTVVRSAGAAGARVWLNAGPAR
ncbi:PfkB family carbohydrate kinase, partial [Roseobacter sinensis]